MEITELQCDSNLRQKFGLLVWMFSEYLSHDYLKLKDPAAKLLCMLATTYFCEEIYPSMSTSKRQTALKAVIQKF